MRAVHIQGVFFNWSYPKNHKYGKKLKYQNWSYPKIHKYGKKLKYQNWSSPKIHKYQNWSPPQICNYGAALKVIDFQVIIMGICAYGDGMNTCFVSINRY